MVMLLTCSVCHNWRHLAVVKDLQACLGQSQFDIRASLCVASGRAYGDVLHETQGPKASLELNELQVRETLRSCKRASLMIIRPRETVKGNPYRTEIQAEAI